MPKAATILTALLICALPAHAHIGSPDTFVQATAGPYNFLIAAHPPAAYPGVLELDLRFNGADHITTASASLDSGPPTPIRIFDAGTATTTIWLPTPAAHTIHIAVQGSTYDLTLPSATVPTPARISRGHIGVWILLAVALAAAAIVLALRKPKLILYAGAMMIVACVLAAFASHLSRIARAQPSTTLSANLSPDGTLDFILTNPSENFANLVPDDGKLMHLFLIRQPQEDVFLHLHPHQLSPGHFAVSLPAMPPGTYQLFTDFYYSPTGNSKDARSETDTETLTLPAQFHPAPADPDNTIAVLPPALPNITPSGVAMPDGMLYTAVLRDNYTLTLRTPATLHPLSPNLFVVTLLDPSGQPPADMALYLGMPAHAVVLRSDNGVFAHIHPGGTLPMLTATASDAPGLASETWAQPMPDMPGMDTTMPAVSNTATIPYGFPAPGRYRIFVQMKHGPIVETAAFDLTVN